MPLDSVNPDRALDLRLACFFGLRHPDVKGHATLADLGSSGSFRRLASVLSSGIFVLGLALSASALAAGGGSVGVGGDEGGGLGGGGGGGIGAGGGGGVLAPRAEA